MQQHKLQYTYISIFKFIYKYLCIFMQHNLEKAENLYTIG